MWTAVGGALVGVGIFWLFEGGTSYRVLLLALAVAGGAAKSRWALEPAGRRIVERIQARGDGTCLGGFIGWRMWLLVALFATLGRILRGGLLPHAVVGWLYAAIGTGLLLASRLAWGAWLAEPRSRRKADSPIPAKAGSDSEEGATAMIDARNRPYRQLRECIVCHGNRQERMEQVVDALWNALKNTGVSWIGFYLPGEGEMVLGPCRDKPACSPIGMHGACGQAFKEEKAIVVHDVAELGENYIACDPDDRSEVVVPLFDERGKCWAVLDADSHEVGSFSEDDAAGLTAVMLAAGLTQTA